MLAPVILFAYRRPEHVSKALRALRENTLAAESDLVVYVDGPGNPSEVEAVQQVREVVSGIYGFKSVTVHAREEHLGLARSVITGVTAEIEARGKVIVLEDDHVTTPDFLTFMNAALDYYEANPKVFSVSGYAFPLKGYDPAPYDVYFSYRASSWGWGSWADRWLDIDWDVKDYDEFMKSRSLRRLFNRGGPDMVRMLRRQMEGRSDSWAIRWAYNMFKRDQLTAYAASSKLVNIGFGKGAAHTRWYNIYDARHQAPNDSFSFSPTATVNRDLERAFRYNFLYRRKLFRAISQLFRVS